MNWGRDPEMAALLHMPTSFAWSPRSEQAAELLARILRLGKKVYKKTLDIKFDSAVDKELSKIEKAIAIETGQWKTEVKRPARSSTPSSPSLWPTCFRPRNSIPRL